MSDPNSFTAHVDHGFETLKGYAGATADRIVLVDGDDRVTIVAANGGVRVESDDE